MTQLTPSKLQFAEHAINQWYVEPEHGTAFEALLDPKYWAHVAAQFKPRDIIIVNAEDGSWYGRLIVRDAGRLYATMAQIEYIEFEKAEIGVDQSQEGHEVKFRGRIKKWCVLRGADVLKEGAETREIAQQWLREHLRTVAA